MRTRWMVGVVAGMALWAAAPAGATQIGMNQAGRGANYSELARNVYVLAGAGEANDIEVRVNRPSPFGIVDEGSPFAMYAADMVTVKDHGATFAPGLPPYTDQPCTIIDPHTARCTVTGPQFIVETSVILGDGNDRLRFAPAACRCANRSRATRATMTSIPGPSSPATATVRRRPRR